MNDLYITEPAIIDAVQDQHHGRWVRFGTAKRSCWFSLHELHMTEKEVLSRLSDVGATLLTTPSKNAFKKAVEACKDYRPALVAAHPGWLGGHYVFGDGEVIAPPGDTREVIIAFQPNPKFTPLGTLTDWQDAVGLVVAGQRLPLFVVSFSFNGSVLRFAPPHIHNPQAEIVGNPEFGKSTLVVLAASVWAGDPDDDVGGCETWDLTLNALDPQKLAHADNLLALDEGNLAGTTPQDQKQLLQKAVFKLATSGGRKRYTDQKDVPNVRLALLSSSNLPLKDIVRVQGTVGGALATRMVTIQIDKDRPFGTLDFLPKGRPEGYPKGFGDSQAAMQYLRAVVNKQYGTAGRAFVSRLVEEAAKDEQKLRDLIERKMKRYLAELRKRQAGRGSARVANAGAVTYAAASLARKWGIIPKEWGKVGDAILGVFSEFTNAAASTPQSSALDRIMAYVEEHRTDLVVIDKLEQPYAAQRFETAAGFLRRVDGHHEILIPAQRFRQAFPDHRHLMIDLRKAGHAKTEGGDQPKLTIKAPKAICDSGRVYCIRLGRVGQGKPR